MLNRKFVPLAMGWIILITLTLLVFYGEHVLKKFHTPSISIILKEGETVEVTLTRTAPDNLGLEIDHKRDGRDGAELGEWAPNLNSPENALVFDNPGPEVRVSASNSIGTVIYETLPVSSRSKEALYRDLTVFINDNDRHSFPDYTMSNGLQLKSGETDVKITIEKVDPELVGELVNINIDSPVTFKSTADGYGFWWWFTLAVIYKFILGVYLLSLMIWSIAIWNKRYKRP